MELKTYFAQDRNGSLIPSATVAIYLTGTTTLASGLTTVSNAPLANPFTADADGKIQFHAPDGIYDMQVSLGSTTGVKVTFQCVDVEQQLADANTAADRAETAAANAEAAAEGIEDQAASTSANLREQWRRTLADAGLNLVAGSFEAGATASTNTDAVWHIAGGQCYTWGGTLPKTVPENSTPDSTGGISGTAWKVVTDAAVTSVKATVDGFVSRDNRNIAKDDSLVTPGMFTAMRAAENGQHYVNGTTIPKNAAIPYDHFGLTFKNRRGQAVTIFRRGPTHVTSRGVLMKTVMNAAGQWASPVEITTMSDSVLDARVAAGGMMPDGRIVVCCNYMNPTTSEFDDVKFFESQDDGETWALIQTVDVNQSGGYSYNIPFGPVAAMGAGVAIARYKRVGSTFSIGYFYSEDGGKTWAEKDVFSDATGTNDYNESGLCCIGRMAFMVSRIGSGITGKFRLFRSTDGGTTWNDIGDSNLTGGDGAYVVAPTLHILRNSNGTPFVVLSYVDRTAQAMYYRTALVSDILSGVYTFSARERITGGLTNSSGYQSGFFEGHRFIGVVYQEETAQTSAKGVSVEYSVKDVPDYDSGWFAVAASQNYPLTTTGISQQMSKARLLFSPDNVGGTVYEVDATVNSASGTLYGIGALLQFSPGTITVKSASRVYANTLYGTGGTEWTTGYYRLLAWL